MAPMQLYVEYHEHKQLDCVVLLHGAGMDSRMWAGLVPLLTPTHAVITMDLRRHGLSPDPGNGGPPEVEELAEDVTASLKALARSSAVVVGACIGGYVAATLVRHDPGTFRGLGLVAAPFWADADTQARWQDLADHATSHGMESLAGAHFGLWRKTSAATDGDDQREALARADRDVFAFYSRMVAQLDLREQLAQVDVPAAVVAGAEDSLAPPELLQATAERLPGATLTVIAGARHLPAVERPSELLKALQPCLSPPGDR